jgi:hypothetical protein
MQFSGMNDFGVRKDPGARESIEEKHKCSSHMFENRACDAMYTSLHTTARDVYEMYVSAQMMHSQ